jgi:mono/diheme cytochrome c family protein
MLGVGALAGLFIIFAALSAFYFPRRSPDFPGNRLGLFALVTVVLFAGTMAGMIVFAKEEGHGATKGEHAAADSGPTTTEAHATTTVPTAGGGTGDPAAGEAVFMSAGCGGCHTLKAAGASGNVGPNLDEAKPDFALVVDRVTNGKGAMPSFKGSLDEKQIQDVAAFVVQSTQG